MQDDRKILNHERGPFDIIGDVHGCYPELVELLNLLGYEAVEPTGSRPFMRRPPPGRKAVFVGDLVGRGPKIVEVLKLVFAMSESGTALCVPGNHDIKLIRKLQGRPAEVTHGLAESLTQLDTQTEEFRQSVITFFDSLPDHLILNEGRLVVVHAGLKQAMHGQSSPEVRRFALFGEKTGEIDAFGFPVRSNWAADYHGDATVVYGHTPVRDPQWINGTLDVDTGCIFGGKLSALRYPEGELVSVPAHHIYWPGKPYLRAEPERAVQGSQHPALSLK